MIYLRRFDVVVEVVPKRLDVRDHLRPSLSLEMAREQDESDVSNLSFPRRETRDVLQLKRRVVPEEHLRCILDGPLPGIDEFLQEDLAEDSVRLVAEDGAEDDGHAVVARLDEDGLLLAI